MKKQIPVSVIINTADRAKYIGETLEGLKQQTYDNFEVVLVNGPSEDNTEEVAKAYNIRYYTAPYNLSKSRNIGVKAASGEILLFIDDDAVPSPTWVEEIVAAYEDPTVGAAGGFVYHTGNAHYQFCYGAINMWGLPRVEMEPTVPFDYNEPNAEWYNINIGTNSSYRRNYLIEVGGYDEEYEYYHDESDVCVRMIDGGYKVIGLEGAVVHHKMAPSSRRKSWKSVVNWDSMVKNGIYFAIKHSKGKAGLWKRIRTPGWEERHKFRLTARALKHGEINIAQFIYKVFGLYRSMFRGYYRGFFKPQQLITDYTFEPKNFKKYKTEDSKPVLNRRRIVLISQGFPPAATDGIARYNYTLARELVRQGHIVSVVTKSLDGRDQTVYQDGYWLYYHNPDNFKTESMGYDRLNSILASSKSVYNTVKAIKELEGVDLILAPLWDVEGLALIRHKIAPIVVTLMSPLKKVVETQWSNVDDPSIEYVYDLERYAVKNADRIMTISQAVADTIEKEYGIDWSSLAALPRVLPLGVDSAFISTDMPAPKKKTGMDILFVGRFEKRKGIDLLLSVIPTILEKHKDVTFTLIGNSDVYDPEGKNYWNDFTKTYKHKLWFSRIKKSGYVTDDELAKAYAATDIFVAPSRYESFGLIFIEAMASGKAVIGTKVGGIPETVKDGATGLLFTNEDVKDLESKIEQLIKDEKLRNKLGTEGKKSVQTVFSAERMGNDFIKIVDELVK